MSAGIGGTLTNGIQDISALLPLLGTEQCENHISSALTKGHLYSAATPLSIFGSLGAARAGFKTLVASTCIPRWNINGGRFLANMGFEPQGLNLPLIMMDQEEGNKDCYLLESRLKLLLESNHIDKPQDVKVEYDCIKWNFTMILLTAFLSSLSVVPYIYLNIKAGGNLSQSTRWAFPVIRAIGGFLISTTTPILIQRRIAVITTNCLNAMAPENSTEDLSKKQEDNSLTPPKGDKAARLPREPSDAEKGLQDKQSVKVDTTSVGGQKNQQSSNKEMENHEPAAPKAATPIVGNSPFTWLCLTLLLFGVIASVVGYIGCFSVVQASTSATGPLSWLCLETGLSIFRIILWGLNPKLDDAPDLQLVLPLDENAPLPTCFEHDDEIMHGRVLPLTRATPFLESIAAFVGPFERLKHPDVTFYYTMTRTWNEWRTGGRVLFITIFDHKERTLRTYVHDRGRGDSLFASQDLAVNLERGLLEVKLGKRISAEHDPICSSCDFLDALRAHHQAILDRIHRALLNLKLCPSGLGTRTKPQYSLNIGWTMKTTDKKSGEKMEPFSDPFIERDFRYLNHGKFQTMRRKLLADRGKWLEIYMSRVQQTIKDTAEAQWRVVRLKKAQDNSNALHGEMVEAIAIRDVDDSQEPTKANESAGIKGRESILMSLALVEEQCWMEMLLACEAFGWETLLLEDFKDFLSQTRIPLEVEQKLMKHWWKGSENRLEANIHAQEARMETLNEEWGNKEVEQWWKSWRYTTRYFWGEVIVSLECAAAARMGAPDSSSTFMRYSNNPLVIWMRNFQSPCLNNLIRHLGSDCKYCHDRALEERHIFQEGQEFPFHLYQPIFEGLDKVQKEEYLMWKRNMESRLRNETADVDARLKDGLETCDQFWVHPILVDITHFSSKGAMFSRPSYIPPQAYSRAVNRNNPLSFIQIGFLDSDEDCAWVMDRVSKLKSVTYIHFAFLSGNPAFRQKFQEIQSIVAENLQKQLEIIGTEADVGETITFVEREGKPSIGGSSVSWMGGLSLPRGSRLKISFLAPKSGSFTLRLVLPAQGPFGDYATLQLEVARSPPLRFKVEVQSRTIVNVPLLCRSSDPLSFAPEKRNELTLKVAHPSFVVLEEIQLLKDGIPYNGPGICAQEAEILV